MEELLRPDPYSQSKEFEGRRILTRIEPEHHAHPLLAELIERLTGPNPA